MLPSRGVLLRLRSCSVGTVPARGPRLWAGCSVLRFVRGHWDSDGLAEWRLLQALDAEMRSEGYWTTWWDELAAFGG
jgi:hypothetical protein